MSRSLQKLASRWATTNWGNPAVNKFAKAVAKMFQVDDVVEQEVTSASFAPQVVFKEITTSVSLDSSGDTLHTVGINIARNSVVKISQWIYGSINGLIADEYLISFVNIDGTDYDGGRGLLIFPRIDSSDHQISGAKSQLFPLRTGQHSITWKARTAGASVGSVLGKSSLLIEVMRDSNAVLDFDSGITV